MVKIDVRGISCPEPVLMTKKAADKGASSMEIIADDRTAVNNISRFLKSAGYTFEINEKDEDTIIIARG